ncbi:hypothetical protein RHMOL_Rhmol09G0066300 [Rhododendron molle]|uniref:Uncharacterized protein n=1 Tax=Rhododendron molle TaxID=49168 RepID=A0ACC0MB70_RHOML|nr:hypothetical protein RHMOL_Rhmol09G0066300 [Rhododendron molle]
MILACCHIKLFQLLLWRRDYARGAYAGCSGDGATSFLFRREDPSDYALLFELCHEAFHKFSMGLCIESLRRVAGCPISDFCLKSKHISEPKYCHSLLLLCGSMPNLLGFWSIVWTFYCILCYVRLGTGPDGLRIYLAFRILTQLKMRLNHYDNSEMNCVKSFKAFRLPNACR